MIFQLRHHKFLCLRRNVSPLSSMPSSKNSAPRFDVIIKMVFLKSTVRLCESVIRPSSSTCSKTLNTSGCAFSISSKRTTEYGLRRTASVNCPPLHNQHIPEALQSVGTQYVLHIFTHIDTNHVRFIIKQALGKTLQARFYQHQ